MNDPRFIPWAEAELARQDAQFDAFAQALTSLGDVQLGVPHEVLEELDAATKPMNLAAPIVGIRG